MSNTDNEQLNFNSNNFNSTNSTIISTSPSIFKKIKSLFSSLLFDLPLQNYHDLYKTGKLQNMTKEEKIKLLIDQTKKNQLRKFFRRLLIIRPNFLDDEDLVDYNEYCHKIKNYRGVVISLFFANWTYFVYNFFMKRRMVIKSFLIQNLIITIVYLKTSVLMDEYQNKLYDKYKNIIVMEDIEKMMKESYRID